MLAIRDTVHKWIQVSPAEMKLIDHPLFQRLRHIKQLTGANLVYPDACHTRFSHSLGVMYVATLYAKSIAAKYPQDYTPQWVANVRIAALLHDIAHGPFSHAWDHYIYSRIYPYTDKGHDEHRKKLVRSEPFCECITDCGVSPEDVIQVWEDRGVAGAIVSGPLGADRTDFLLRDSHMCGMQHLGGIDYFRLMHNVEVRNNHLIYPSKLLAEIEAFLSGRIAMYDNVYLHKTAIAADYILMHIIQNSCDQLELVERTIDLDKFVYLTDSSIIEGAKSVDSAKRYVERYLNRDLPKLIPCESTTHGSGINTRDLETLDKTKFNMYNIQIQDDGIYYNAYEWLQQNSTIRDKTIKRNFLLKIPRMSVISLITENYGVTSATAVAIISRIRSINF